MCFFLLTACEPKRIVEHLPTPPERLVCEERGDRPAIPAEYVIDWTRVTTVAQAKVEHQAHVTRVRQREAAVTGYIISLEGKLFVCSSNMKWRRDFEASLRAQG